ncbi:MAG: type III secretion system chaperone [Duodenibacillus sp.]|nr:type III secretion system chaperone [Oscillospiraceae bacterium]MCF0253250.1 type III secretion system chaperone [Duodenibacillus sp.]
MRNTLNKLVSEYAEKNGMECNMEPGSCQATLVCEGLEVQLGLAEESGMLLIQTGVGLLQTTGGEEYCRMILAANNAFSGTQGFTLGLDEDLELITLQVTSPLMPLTDETFSNLMNNLLTVAADWLVRLNDWRPSAPEVSDDVLSMGDYIRI